jgi:putative oxidoreductase
MKVCPVKIASIFCRYFLGTLFTVFGANGFLHFLKVPPPTSIYAMQFFIVVSASHFMVVPFLTQLIGGILLLADLYAPFALVMLAAVLVNIWDFHITMDRPGIGPAVIATLLWIGAALPYRANFRGLFAQKAEPCTHAEMP